MKTINAHLSPPHLALHNARRGGKYMFSAPGPQLWRKSAKNRENREGPQHIYICKSKKKKPEKSPADASVIVRSAFVGIRNAHIRIYICWSSLVLSFIFCLLDLSERLLEASEIFRGIYAYFECTSSRCVCVFLLYFLPISKDRLIRFTIIVISCIKLF